MSTLTQQIRQNVITALQLAPGQSMTSDDLREITGHSGKSFERTLYWMKERQMVKAEKVHLPEKGGRLFNRYTLLSAELPAGIKQHKAPVPAIPPVLTICLSLPGGKEARLSMNDARFVFNQLKELFPNG